MSTLVRRSTGACARLLMVLLLLGTAVPFAVHGDAGHDPCESSDIPSTARASIHAAGAAAPRQHCDVCHWLRSLRAFDIVVAAPSAPVEGGWLASSAGVSHRSRLDLPAAPSRAPPA
jgi:hypothetical protein